MAATFPGAIEWSKFECIMVCFEFSVSNIYKFPIDMWNHSPVRGLMSFEMDSWLDGWTIGQMHEKMIIHLSAKCQYNSTQSLTISLRAVPWHWQNINQILNSQKTPHISPLRVSYGVSIVRICEKIDCVITASHCTNHWGRAAHICVGKLTIIGSDNGLSPGRRQAIIWTIVGILLIGPLGTNFSEISIVIQTFSFMKMNLKMASARWRPFVSASMC